MRTKKVDDGQVDRLVVFTWHQNDTPATVSFVLPRNLHLVSPKSMTFLWDKSWWGLKSESWPIKLSWLYLLLGSPGDVFVGKQFHFFVLFMFSMTSAIFFGEIWKIVLSETFEPTVAWCGIYRLQAKCQIGSNKFNPMQVYAGTESELATWFVRSKSFTC